MQKILAREPIIGEVDALLQAEQVAILLSVTNMQDELKQLRALKSPHFAVLADQMEKVITWILELNELYQLARAEIQKERYDLAVTLMSAKTEMTPPGLGDGLEHMCHGLELLQVVQVRSIRKTH